MGTITKNTLNILLMILLMGKSFFFNLDFLHLQNQILKSKYKLLYGKGYVPLHNRISETIQKASSISITEK